MPAFKISAPRRPKGVSASSSASSTIFRGSSAKHTLQFGVNNRNNRITSTANQTGSIIGTYSFGSVSDFAMATLRTQRTTTASRSRFPLLPTVHLRVDSLGFYGQDEWKILKNLNLTYGARFEYQGNPWCKETCYSRANTEFLANGYQAAAPSLQRDAADRSHKDFIQFEGIIPSRVAVRLFAVRRRKDW
jgi:hypothetical protein